MKAILGRKMGMTSVFAEDGTLYPVTVVEVLPNVVTQVKTVEKDGYVAVQVGYEEKKASRANKCEKGIAAKANTVPHYVSAELKGDEMANYQLGDVITADMFKAGDIVDVIGTSKGHGYTGTIKRWHMTIGPKGHGSGYHRGQGTFANNGRYNHGVMPGKHMSGHWGNESVTILNLTVVDVNVEKGYILIKGGLPGAKKSIVTIRSAVKEVKNVKPVKGLIDRTPAPVEEAPATEAPATEAAE
jgi:large subunit ribosomal protein L3